MKELDQIYLYWFAFHANLSDKKKRELLDMSLTPKYLYHMKHEERKQYFYPQEEERFVKSCTLEKTKQEIEWANRNHVRIIFWTEEEYPTKLKKIYDYPLGLFIKGKLPDEKTLSIAMVGARDITPYGMQAADYFSSQLARRGVQIISGLARGVDGYSHKGALKADGYTLGVLGCGIDLQYPKSNRYLYDQMEQTGGIISEFSPGTPPIARNFPKRNRIISGMSDGVFVLEAKKRSGSLITADLALEQGRDVFALSGRYYDDMSSGCLELIQKGAKLVYKPENIIEEFPFAREIYTNFTNVKKISLANQEKLVYDCLRLEPKYIDHIVSECKLPISEVLTTLTMLEVKQCIIQEQKNYYRIKE